MIDIDKWQEIFSSLQRHKLRTFLTALSVWWGIFMLVILLGASKGLQNSTKEDFESDAVNSLWIWTESTSVPYQGLPPGRQIKFDQEDYETVAALDGIKNASARFWMSGDFFISYKNKKLAYNVQSVRPEHLYIEKPELLSGRFLNLKDIEATRKVCVIGQPVKDEFFKDEDPLGANIKIKGVEFMVVGVFTEEKESETRRVYLPITTAQRIEGSERVHNIIVELEGGDLEESLAMEKKIRSIMASKHKIAPSDRKAIGIFNGIENYMEIQTVMKMMKIFIWFVGIGSIIAGVIGVSNIMLIIVKDRTKEIGVRKALGATPKSIVTMIVHEAIFLTSLAGYFGLASGVALIYGVQQIMEQNEIEAEFFKNPEIDLVTILIALGILIVSGAVAGLIPALQAVRINPVVAMKG